MTTTSKTSCLENTMVLSARQGFMHAFACMYFLIIIIINFIYIVHKSKAVQGTLHDLKNKTTIYK